MMIGAYLKSVRGMPSLVLYQLKSPQTKKKNS